SRKRSAGTAKDDCVPLQEAGEAQRAGTSERLLVPRAAATGRRRSRLLRRVGAFRASHLSLRPAERRTNLVGHNLNLGALRPVLILPGTLLETAGDDHSG